MKKFIGRLGQRLGLRRIIRIINDVLSQLEVLIFHKQDIRMKTARFVDKRYVPEDRDTKHLLEDFVRINVDRSSKNSLISLKTRVCFANYWNYIR